MEVPIELIRPSPYQPRLTFNTDDLKEEIEMDGLLSALVVRKHDDHYELLDGERRLRTLKKLEWKMVPVDVREVDNATARRSVFKLNIVRENYTAEEKAKYFKKLADEGMTFYQIGKDLNVDDQWVLAHINVFRFPQDIQEAVWTGSLTIKHIQTLETEIGANIGDAEKVAREIMLRKLSVRETEELVRPGRERIEKARVEAAKEVIGVATPKISLETPQDYEKAAAALKEEAKRRGEALLTPEERAAREAEAQARAEAKGKRAEERQRRQEAEAREKVTQELLENPVLLRQASERLADLRRKEREARLKAKYISPPMPLTEADLVHKVVIGDAKEVLQLLRPSSVDLVVTSPPYFGLKDYEHNLGVNTESLNHYLDDLNKVLQECHRTLKDGTFLCIVVGQYTSADTSYFIPGQVSGLLEDLGFRYKREHIWVKPLGVQGIWNRGTTSFLSEPYPRNTMINIHHEHILIFQKGERPIVFPGQSPLTEEEVKQYCWSIWELLVSPTKDHPAPFPDSIPERLIKMYSYEGEVVLDPFLGSGTTLKIAKALKRRSIGIEVSPEYLNLIQETVGGAEIIRFDEGEIPDFSYLVTPKT
ncbi:Nucleoid occlusion protein [subsurface metagenome]